MRFLLLCVFVGCAVMGMAKAALVKNFFNIQGKDLTYFTEDWGVRSREGVGFASLTVKDAEFLAGGKTWGGILLHDGQRFITYFPDASNIEHDRSLGHTGYVADGTYMVKISPDWRLPRFELYAGFNAPGMQKLYVFLNDEVALIRGGNPVNERTMYPYLITRQSKTPVKAESMVVVHGNGPALIVNTPCTAGMFADPDGKQRLALVFDVKGFAANSIQMAVETQGAPEYFVAKPTFRVKSSDDPQTNAFVLGATAGVVSPIYGKDTKLDFNIDFSWLGAQPFTGYAEVEITHALGQPHFYQRIDFKGAKPGADGLLTAHFTPKFTLPGVSEVWGRLVGADGRLLWVDRYRMAYEYEAYKPKLAVPADFTAFWEQTLHTLRAAPLDAQTTRVEKYADHPTLEIYEASFASWGGKRIYAMLYVPKARNGLLPAIITSHPATTGYEITKNADGTYPATTQDLRYVTIVPLIRGFAPDAPNVPFNLPWWGPLDDRDTYVARSWYCAMVRAVDYLATRTDLVDMRRLIATGGSQGGALALITAALDQRIAVCVADCPALCQPQEIIEHYPSFGPSKGCVPAGKTLAQVEELLGYYNPVNFCPRITCPTYVGSNIGDLTVHSMGPLAAYQNLTALQPAQKAFYPGYTTMHGSGPGLGVKGQEWREKLAAP